MNSPRERSSASTAPSTAEPPHRHILGIEGIVIDTQKFSRRMSLSEDERKAFEDSLKQAENEGNAAIAEAFGKMVEQIEGVLKKKLTDEDGQPLVEAQEHRFVAEQETARMNGQMPGHVLDLAGEFEHRHVQAVLRVEARRDETLARGGLVMREQPRKALDGRLRQAGVTKGTEISLD